MLAVFTPRPPLSRGQSGAGLPLAPWALLLCWGSPMPETHSPRVILGGEAGLGARSPSTPTPQPCPLSQLGRSAPRPRRTDGPKRASGSCILQRETLLGQQTTAPTRLGSRKQCRPFSPPGPALHMANRGWAALAPWALLLCLVSPVPETHSPRVLLRGEAGLGARSFLRPSPSHAP